MMGNLWFCTKVSSLMKYFRRNSSKHSPGNRKILVLPLHQKLTVCDTTEGAQEGPTQKPCGRQEEVSPSTEMETSKQSKAGLLTRARDPRADPSHDLAECPELDNMLSFTTFGSDVHQVAEWDLESISSNDEIPGPSSLIKTTKNPDCKERLPPEL
ncbi:zinc finger protein 280B isoform X2 [Dipodomys spectabilis]|uniref:zinc finger protein 280B isoform X2 n=1 Tax=Dipodomys spectabilis TaxID=105255 RepID=UPI001C536389|nr:zinc finger protein 280B isoform X2 [Dipodomys spectabilis]